MCQNIIIDARVDNVIPPWYIRIKRRLLDIVIVLIQSNLYISNTKAFHFTHEQNIYTSFTFYDYPKKHDDVLRYIQIYVW